MGNTVVKNEYKALVATFVVTCAAAWGMDATSPGDAPQLSLRNWRAPVQAAREAVPGFVWLEAEGFRDYGKWHLDTQFVFEVRVY